MESEPWRVIVCGVAVDQDTGEVRSVRMGWHGRGEAGAWFLECEDRVLREEGCDPEYVRRYTRLIFGGAGGGGQQAEPAEIVNLDGSPRPVLRDRLARRLGQVEAMAAD